ncbi:hypothetical protein CLIT_10c02120 [Peptoclostridium litorale DSM 5388]|uniref:Uncharacterized protein n=1 Tax=Peptoclostridium litorale DSM 5388 TaxID=1121324 RepID=A0A069RH39_PEPLI|nr:hypothetical protein CLIT_10c02120 [Peptoclostridium litorale DSM 5388]
MFQFDISQFMHLFMILTIIFFVTYSTVHLFEYFRQKNGIEAKSARLRNIVQILSEMQISDYDPYHKYRVWIYTSLG